MCVQYYFCEQSGISFNKGHILLRSYVRTCENTVGCYWKQLCLKQTFNNNLITKDFYIHLIQLTLVESSKLGKATIFFNAGKIQWLGSYFQKMENFALDLMFSIDPYFHSN